MKRRPFPHVLLRAAEAVIAAPPVDTVELKLGVYMLTISGDHDGWAVELIRGHFDVYAEGSGRTRALALRRARRAWAETTPAASK